MYVCVCKGITDSQIENAVKSGVRSVRELNQNMGLCSQCGRCGKSAKEVLTRSISCNDEATLAETTSA